MISDRIPKTDNSEKSRMVFLTGASRGIGAAIAELLLANGYRVALGYCHYPGETTKLADMFPTALPVMVDIGEQDSITSAIDAVRRHFGVEIDILINNGAIAQEKPFLELTSEDWDRMLSVNLRGPFMFSKEVLPAMLSQQWGRIINIVSIGGQWGGMNQVHYAAAKAGLINLTRSLAKLYSGRGVTANAVSPGLVATDMTRSEIASERGQAKIMSIPAGRIGTAREVAAAVMFLCSDDAGYITGQTINVNGGMYFG
ncbi:MAG: 3-oxoacyl-ACP reductase FabG [Geobacter sp.]|nr:3-oxoacyl-ACP reductase FabG [Geobacter sp.]